MTDLRKAAEMALEAWDWDWSEPRNEALRKRMEALRQALAQPEQEPVAWGFRRIIDGVILDIKNSDEHEGYEETYTVPLYTAPPKRDWVGLTDEEVEYWRGNYDFFDSALVREVEAKLKEKNT